MGGKWGVEVDRSMVLKIMRPKAKNWAAQEWGGFLGLSVGQGLPAWLFL